MSIFLWNCITLHPISSFIELAEVFYIQTQSPCIVMVLPKVKSYKSSLSFVSQRQINTNFAIFHISIIMRFSEKLLWALCKNPVTTRHPLPYKSKLPIPIQSALWYIISKIHYVHCAWSLCM